MSPCGVFASDAFERLEKVSNILPGSPEITPSSSTTTMCSSSFDPPLSAANAEVPGALSTES